MNTIKSGKILLNKYNKVHNTHLNAKEFFCTIVAPLLFYGEKHLVYWMNSKFSNASGSWVKSCKNKTYNMELLNTTLEEFCAPIDNPVHNVLTTLNVFGGSCIPDFDAKTLFLYSDNLDFSVEECYYSFIGSIVSLQIEGWNAVVNDEDTIWEIFEGIQLYRKIVNENSNFKGNQLYAWNTAYLHSKYFNDIDTICDEFFDKNGKIEIHSKIRFSNFLCLLFKINRNISVLDFFRLGNMNQTCTTVLLDLEYIGSTYQLLKQVYKEINADFKYADFNKYFGDKSLFIKAIETGYVSKGFFNPKTDTQDSNKNKNIIKFLDLIMTNEHKELAKSLAILVKKHQKESKLVYNHDVKIYDVKKKSDLIRNISEITDDFSYIDFITDDKLTKEDLYNFLAYSRAYFLTLKK